MLYGAFQQEKRQALLLGAKDFNFKTQVTQNEWPFIMQGSDTMDYYFTRGEDRSEQIKKHIKEAAQSIIDHADDIVDQYDLLTDLKIEMNLNPDNDWLPKVQVTSSFLSERTIVLKKNNETGDTM